MVDHTIHALLLLRNVGKPYLSAAAALLSLTTRVSHSITRYIYLDLYTGYRSMNYRRCVILDCYARSAGSRVVAFVSHGYQHKPKELDGRLTPAEQWNWACTLHLEWSSSEISWISWIPSRRSIAHGLQRCIPAINHRSNNRGYWTQGDTGNYFHCWYLHCYPFQYLKRVI